MKRKDNNLEVSNTQARDYTELLIAKQQIGWKRFIDVQAPYRWNLQRLNPGLTLDLGCGIGRNLINLKGKGVGIDHNLNSIKVARNRGLTVFTPEEFHNSTFNTPQRFDSLLVSHVVEHMNQNQAVELCRKYLTHLKPEGKLIIMTPQEAGYKSDPTHVEFMNFPKLQNLTSQLGFKVIKEYSFPFPRILGHLFLYNEFVSVSSRAI
ncbi:Methyltransferase type 12 [Stanieria cyanosphaera PCC 7437]|uniref:Methyltransferase type 12 n=1 Tax=Stanieria cyanosphaera (strain ATCC 29371 / PCC 7437) TaxID=111780 RepID=K9XR25_STAC7|nr:class I SAM-dependent methyltransferase [Stanieria cyanosphaera]AFZ34988.1 Methyltransferase type 12 [Stanieria cyanosphaera PCC 7437]